MELKIERRKLVAGIAAIGAISLGITSAGAATLTTASVALSDSRPSTASVTYTYQASGFTAANIRCIRLEFDTAADGTGTKPAGMNIASLALNASSTAVTSTNFGTVTNTDATGISTFTGATGQSPVASGTLVFTGITNGSTVNTGYFLRVNTYDNVDCSTTPRDDNVVMFVFVDGQAVSLSVDPSLSFSVTGRSSGGTCNGVTLNQATTGNTVPLGKPTAGTNRIAAQNLNLATNAGNGYTVSTRFTGRPIFGSREIADHTGTNAAPTAFSAAGTESFGYTTDDATLSGASPDRFTSGGAKWAAFTTSNAEVAYGPAAVSSRIYCIAYQVGVSGTTPAGTYLTTVIHTATPVF